LGDNIYAIQSMEFGALSRTLWCQIKRLYEANFDAEYRETEY